MFILEYKYPVAVNVGKIDYNMVYRWRQIAMCASKEPLIDYIKKRPNTVEYRIEEYPD